MHQQNLGVSMMTFIIVRRIDYFQLWILICRLIKMPVGIVSDISNLRIISGLMCERTVCIGISDVWQVYQNFFRNPIWITCIEFCSFSDSILPISIYKIVIESLNRVLVKIISLKKKLQLVRQKWCNMSESSRSSSIHELYQLN